MDNIFLSNLKMSMKKGVFLHDVTDLTDPSPFFLPIFYILSEMKIELVKHI